MVRVLDIQTLNAHSETTTTTTTNRQPNNTQHTTQASIPSVLFFCVTCCEWTRAAQRRRERRLRSMLRHERMTVAMVLAEKLHHSSHGDRGLREMNFSATIRNPPPSPPRRSSSALKKSPARRGRTGCLLCSPFGVVAPPFWCGGALPFGLVAPPLMVWWRLPFWFGGAP